MIDCNFCQLKFPNVHQYNKHQACHSDIKDFTYYCKVKDCGQSFVNFFKFRRHNNRLHKKFLIAEHNVKDVLSCRQCNFRSKNIVYLKNHLVKHLNNGTKVHCPFFSCKESYNLYTKNSFKIHLSRYHKNRKNVINNDIENESPIKNDEVNDPLFQTCDLMSVNAMEVEDLNALEENISDVDELDNESISKKLGKLYLSLSSIHAASEIVIQ